MIILMIVTIIPTLHFTLFCEPSFAGVEKSLQGLTWTTDIYSHQKIIMRAAAVYDFSSTTIICCHRIGMRRSEEEMIIMTILMLASIIQRKHSNNFTLTVIKGERGNKREQVTRDWCSKRNRTMLMIFWWRFGWRSSCSSRCWWWSPVRQSE